MVLSIDCFKSCITIIAFDGNQVYVRVHLLLYLDSPCTLILKGIRYVMPTYTHSCKSYLYGDVAIYRSWPHFTSGVYMQQC